MRHFDLGFDFLLNAATTSTLGDVTSRGSSDYVSVNPIINEIITSPVGVKQLPQ